MLLTLLLAANASACDPNDVEVGNNGVDEDCDTHDGIARRYVSDFSSAADWTLWGMAWISGGEVRLGAPSTQPGYAILNGT